MVNLCKIWFFQEDIQGGLLDLQINVKEWCVNQLQSHTPMDQISCKVLRDLTEVSQFSHKHSRET